MLISDYFIGYHSVIMYVYISLLIIFFIGKYLIKENSFNSTMVLSLSSAIIFFIISNFGVWIVGYPKTISGFIACYVAALPFLSNTLISTLLKISCIICTFINALSILIISNENRVRFTYNNFISLA